MFGRKKKTLFTSPALYFEYDTAVGSIPPLELNDFMARLHFPLVCTLSAWKTFAGRRERGWWRWWRAEGEKNHASCIVATFRAFPGKERGQETKKHAGFAQENAALAGEEEEPDAAPLLLHTSADL